MYLLINVTKINPSTQNQICGEMNHIMEVKVTNSLEASFETKLLISPEDFTHAITINKF